MSDLRIEEVSKRGIKGVRATFSLAQSADLVTNLMWDVDQFAKLFPDIKELRLISSEGNSQDVHYRIDAVYKEVQYTLRRVRNDRDNGADIEWKMLKGDLRDIIGAWRITASGESGCGVIYESYVDASVLVPTSMIRKVAKTKIREMVDRVRRATAAAAS
jgi:ribosome-associated toxin RatA of RatAB toxin-antitoxin module